MRKRRYALLRLWSHYITTGSSNAECYIIIIHRSTTKAYIQTVPTPVDNTTVL
jgi:hypothetical protein